MEKKKYGVINEPYIINCKTGILFRFFYSSTFLCYKKDPYLRVFVESIGVEPDLFPDSYRDKQASVKRLILRIVDYPLNILQALFAFYFQLSFMSLFSTQKFFCVL